jgi:hypothetical protein
MVQIVNYNLKNEKKNTGHLYTRYIVVGEKPK